MEKLLPLDCPFCGEKAVVTKWFPDMEEPDYTAGCDFTPCLVTPITNVYKAEEDAIKAWNIRSNQ